MTLKQDFLDPPDEFTPVPFWFWNDALSTTEIIRQIHDFRDHGVMGFVIHPRIGIPREIEYLSDAFLDLVETAVAEAARLGMIVFLYDEAMYPSGSAHGLVVRSNPEYASRGLKMVETPCRGPLELIPALDAGERLVSVQAVRKLRDDEIDRQRTTVLVVDRGRVSFSPPEGESWSILLFVETFSHGIIRGIHFGEDDWEPDAPPSADLLNPAAVDEFIRLTYERYHARLAGYFPGARGPFANTIQAIFTDEPSILGRRATPGLQPWTGGFLDWYLAQGNDERDLPVLWFSAGEDTEPVRRAYAKAVHRRLETSYYAPISDWCSRHGISLTGHPQDSDDIGSQRYFHIPGQDVVFRWVGPEEGKALEGPHSTMGKCSSDAARHAGRRRNANECFACCGALGAGWSLTVDDMKWFMDWLFVRGVNWLVPHAFYYSIDGPRRIGERPPDVGPHNIWWPHYHTIATYIKRMSWLMTGSANTARVAVLCEEDRLPWAIAKPLYERQIEFNYLEDRLLVSGACRAEEGRLEIGEQAYQVILVEDPAWLTTPVADRLAAFLDQGGKVVVYNPKAVRMDLPGVHQIDDLTQLPAFLDGLMAPDVRLVPPSRSLRASHVVKEGYAFYLFTNEGETPIDGVLDLGCVGRPESWDAWEGMVSALPAQLAEDGRLQTRLHLDRRDSLILHLDRDQTLQPTPQPARPTPDQVTHLKGNWMVRGPEGTSAPHALTSWSEWPGMADFSGTLTYDSDFEWAVEEVETRVVLDLGQAGEIAALAVNGQNAGVKMWSPYRFDISRLLKTGSNHLSVTVTNTLANRIDHARQPSGLLGPVTVEVYTSARQSARF